MNKALRQGNRYSVSQLQLSPRDTLKKPKKVNAEGAAQHKGGQTIARAELHLGQDVFQVQISSRS